MTSPSSVVRVGKRARRRLLALAGLAAVISGVTIVSCSLAGTTSRAVPSTATIFLAPTGLDTYPCSAQAPCATLQRGYQAAKPGDTVELAAGDYPGQLVAYDPGKDGTSELVTFRAAQGATVRVASLTIGEPSAATGPHHLEFRDLTVTGTWSIGLNNNRAEQAAQVHDIRMRNVNSSAIFINGAANVSILGGSIGPHVNGGSEITACYRCDYAPQNILIDGVSFHDYTRTDPNKHMECLHVYPAQRFTLRNSSFRNCAVMDLFFANYTGGALSGITIENNRFDTPGSLSGGLSTGFFPVLFAPNNEPITNVRIAYNSLLGPIGFNPGTLNNVEITANVGPMEPFGCNQAVSYSYNVWTKAKCGSSDTTASSGFVDPAGFDLHLQRGAAALGRGNSSAHPTSDFEGQLRPVKMRPDAGADQREAAILVPGQSLGALKIGAAAPDVESFYGKPTRRAKWKPAGFKPPSSRSGKPLIMASYRTRGGALWAIYDGTRVVGMGTTSPYYSTSAGRGVGSPGADFHGFRWIDCRRAYRDYRRGVATYFVPARGEKTGKIVSVSLLRREYEVC